MSALVIVISILISGIYGTDPQNTPVFSDQYYVNGVLSLPYAEINEPFVAYFDAVNNRSRVDYYGDLVQTIQRPDLSSVATDGTSYKLAYMVDSAGNPQRVCFQMNGTGENPVTVTTVLPDLSLFKSVGTEVCPDTAAQDVICERWQYDVSYGEKNNLYVFWLRRDADLNPIPVHYLMKGYDSLLGSHYDKYEISYSNYKSGPINPNVFDLPNNYTCRGFPGPGIEHHALNNPIKEFISGDDSYLDTEFAAFSSKHGKTYQNSTHQTERKNIFRHNYRYIASMNRKNTHFRMAVNHLADFTSGELRLLRGKLFTNTLFNGGIAYNKHTRSVNDTPDQWDWRLSGAVTPVKDQAVCGSCWSFGTTGTIEGVYFVKTGHLIRLSQQQLIDCSWNYGDNGCDGGEDFRAYDYIKSVGGLATEDDYGPYLGADGMCHDRAVKKSVKLNGFYNVTSGDAEALVSALYYNGPVTIAIDASHKSLSFYSNGVYYEPDCGNKPENLDHQVLAVGYGTLQNQRYWLVKNSWSTYWGNDGYVLMNQRDNNCGVLTQPTFPNIDD